MNILGLSFDYHDSAAALLCDGTLIAAAQEERFSRRKNDPSLPVLATEFCLRQAGISCRDLDWVVFYEDSHEKLERIVHASLRDEPLSRTLREWTFPNWLSRGKTDIVRRIAQAVGVPEARIVHLDHHQAHAASAFYASPFERATVLTLDGVGESETATVSIGDASGLTKVRSLHYPDSLGLFYSAFTAFLGFEINEGEYKVMGMSGFGSPRYLDEVRGLIHLEPGGGLTLDHAFFNFTNPLDLPYSRAFLERFGPARHPEDAFRVLPPTVPVEPGSLEARSRHYADIASSVQRVTEEAIFHLVESAVAETGIPDVCFAGGVALNSLANGKLQRRMRGRLYIQPAAGDAGGALGAALHQHHIGLGGARSAPLESVYLGQAYSDEETRRDLDRAGITKFAHFPSFDDLVEALVDRLLRGDVVGWHQGRFEWGPRALGCRSILANPLLPDIQQIVNEKIKFREPFRPFAPAVLAERATEFFDLELPEATTAPEYFMLSVCGVREEKKGLIPAVTHVDGTSRLQLVRREGNPRYHDLIKAFGDRTGVPILLNTSFNLKGEPIVNTPYDALRTFLWSDMDCVVIGNFLVEKGDIQWL